MEGGYRQTGTPRLVLMGQSCRPMSSVSLGSNPVHGSLPRWSDEEHADKQGQQGMRSQAPVQPGRP